LGFATKGVATLGVDFPASYFVPSLSSGSGYVESFVGVSTLDVGL
jgi:hypothetical protein